MKPGDKVFYMRPSYRRSDNPEPIETQIKTIGRKYLTVAASSGAKFWKDTGLQVTDGIFRGRVYFSSEEYEAEKERNKLLSEARQAIYSARINHLTNTQLETLIGLLTPNP